MKTAKDVVPFFKNYPYGRSPEINRLFEDVPNGALAQDLLVKCENGMDEREFETLASSAGFKEALTALQAAFSIKDEKDALSILRSCATLFRRLRLLDGTVPWELYGKAFPCLQNPNMEPVECRNTQHCQCVLSRRFFCVFEAILFRHEILSRDGGIFADRLVTAIDLGVPFERLKHMRDVNLPVAIATLREFFPDCDEQWVEEMTSRAAKGWEDATKAPPVPEDQNPCRGEA